MVCNSLSRCPEERAGQGPASVLLVLPHFDRWHRSRPTLVSGAFLRHSREQGLRRTLPKSSPRQAHSARQAEASFAVRCAQRSSSPRSPGRNRWPREAKPRACSTTSRGSANSTPGAEASTGPRHERLPGPRDLRARRTARFSWGRMRPPSVPRVPRELEPAVGCPTPPILLGSDPFERTRRPP
jgi:hypothetical protein